MRITLAAISVTLALASAAVAQSGPENAWLQDGQSFKAPANIVNAGEFVVMQIATVEPDRFEADWSKSSDWVPVNMTTETVRHRPIVTFLLFSSCRADASGNCNLTADVEMTDPAGRRYNLSRGSKVWAGPPPPGHSLGLSAEGYGAVFEEKDALGRYRVQATVTDHVSGVSLHTEQTLVVSAR